VPIEQGLVIKYGELVRKQELQDKTDSFNTGMPPQRSTGQGSNWW